MPNFIVPLLHDKKIQMYGDGSQIMDMIYVKDVADILVRAALMDHGVYDTAFEAGTGRLTTVYQIASIVARACNLMEDIDYIDFLPMRPGEPENAVVVGDPTTLKPLGIEPEKLTTLEDGVWETIKYYRAQGS
jgi:nucleoside-diphosphate-sugar epimerase